MSTATPTRHRAEVTWDADRDDPRAHTVRLAGQTLAGSSQPDLGGDPEKADPEEMLVAALSACHMLWFLALARRARLPVLSYEDSAEGTMDGTRFTSVTLRPRVRFGGQPPLEDTVGDLHERARARCVIANSVSCPVEVRPA